MKTSKIILALVASVFLMSGTAFALHSGGVAHCDACHSMHGGSGNGDFVASSPQYLLNGSDASSTCLNCHASADGDGYHVKSDVGNGTSQGGDFFWITSAAAYDYEAWGGGPTVTVDTDNLGHNVVASDFTMAADATNTTAPGGGPTASGFGCHSCHDPHGQVNGGTANSQLPISVSGSYVWDTADATTQPPAGTIAGNFRLLGGSGYTPDSYPQSIPAAAPIAGSLNGGYGQSYGIQTDYGTGVSSWCLSCHPNFQSGFNMHPTDTTGFSANYNSYVATGDFTGDVTTAYDSLVPFEREISDPTLLDPTSTQGADATSEVMCLTCHRSHASAFNNMLRWDNTVEFLAESKIKNELTTTVDANAIPYYKNGVEIDPATEYGQYQRQLCNKCHVQD